MESSQTRDQTFSPELAARPLIIGSAGKSYIFLTCKQLFRSSIDWVDPSCRGVVCGCFGIWTGVLKVCRRGWVSRADLELHRRAACRGPLPAARRALRVLRESTTALAVWNAVVSSLLPSLHPAPPLNPASTGGEDPGFDAEPGDSSLDGAFLLGCRPALCRQWLFLWGPRSVAASGAMFKLCAAANRGWWGCMSWLIESPGQQGDPTSLS